MHTNNDVKRSILRLYLGLAAFGLLLVLALGLVFHQWYRLEYKAAAEGVDIEATYHLESAVSHTMAELRHASALLLALSQSHAVRGFFYKQAETDVFDDLSTVLRPIISRVVEFRLLDASGMEVLRIVRTNSGNLHFVDRHALVSRASSACFLGAMRMPYGKVFLSPLSVGLPPSSVPGGGQSPVMRMAMQVEADEDGEAKGLVVLYLDGRQLYWTNHLSALPEHESLRRIDPGYVYRLRAGMVDVLPDAGEPAADAGREEASFTYREKLDLSGWLDVHGTTGRTMWEFSERLGDSWLDSRLAGARQKGWGMWLAGSLMVALLLIGVGMSRRRVILADAERRRLLSEVKGLSWRLIRVNEEERRSLARTLHDEVGQVLAGLQMRLDALAQDCEKDHCEASESIRIEERHIGQIIEALRQHMRQLRPPQLDALGLKGALVAMIEGVCDSAGLAFEADIDDAVDELGEESRIRIYRILSEALLNIRRHARAESVRLTLHCRDGRVEGVVEDDGCGFDPDEVVTGFGLIGMRERTELLGGTLEVISAPGEGTRLLMRLPVVSAAPGFE